MPQISTDWNFFGDKKERQDGPKRHTRKIVSDESKELDDAAPSKEERDADTITDPVVEKDSGIPCCGHEEEEVSTDDEVSKDESADSKEQKKDDVDGGISDPDDGILKITTDDTE